MTAGQTQRFPVEDFLVAILLSTYKPKPKTLNFNP